MTTVIIILCIPIILSSQATANAHDIITMDIEKASLEGLCSVVSKGSKYLEYHSYLADKDPMRIGVGISQNAQCLKHAMEHFREQRMEQVLRPEIYSKVKAVVDEIYPKLELLDGGSQYSGGGFKSLGYTSRGSRDERAIEEAARGVYAWLGKESDAFRAYLQILSGGGIVFAAQVEEKMIRSYRAVGGLDENLFVQAASKRLCTEQGRRAGQSARDDLALTQHP